MARFERHLTAGSNSICCRNPVRGSFALIYHSWLKPSRLPNLRNHNPADKTSSGAPLPRLSLYFFLFFINAFFLFFCTIDFLQSIIIDHNHTRSRPQSQTARRVRCRKSTQHRASCAVSRAHHSPVQTHVLGHRCRACVMKCITYSN